MGAPPRLAQAVVKDRGVVRPANVARGVRGGRVAPGCLAGDRRIAARRPTHLWTTSHDPLIVAYADANRPAAIVDTYPRRTLPRLVTADRRGQPPLIEVPAGPSHAPDRPPTLPGLGGVPLPEPATAYLPGFTPAHLATRVMPSVWLALIEAFAGGHSDPREWQRALRLFCEIVSEPPPQERRGSVRVTLAVGGRDSIVRRLWPNDERVREHYPALRRALGMVATAALQTAGGRTYLPAQLARWQPRDAVDVDVLYPTGGGGGAAYDRDRFRTSGPHPHLFRVYLGAVWALDARGLRRHDRDAHGWHADLPLDALADVAAYPVPLGSYRQRDKARRRTRAALDRLADNGYSAKTLVRPAQHCNRLWPRWRPGRPRRSWWRSSTASAGR